MLPQQPHPPLQRGLCGIGSAGRRFTSLACGFPTDTPGRVFPFQDPQYPNYTSIGRTVSHDDAALTLLKLSNIKINQTHSSLANNVIFQTKRRVHACVIRGLQPPLWFILFFKVTLHKIKVDVDTAQTFLGVCLTCPICRVDQSSPPLARVVRVHRLYTSSNPEKANFGGWTERRTATEGQFASSHYFCRRWCIQCTAFASRCLIATWRGGGPGNQS